MTPRPKTLAPLGALALVLCALLFSACTTAETATDTQAPDGESSSAIFGGVAPEEAPPSPAPSPSLRLEAATVVRVVDGDTAVLRIEESGVSEKMRFIGVDTPESTTRHEPYGSEASTYTKRILKPGRRVYLEPDAEPRDRYGRLLVYVWLSRPERVAEDGRPTLAETSERMLNAQLMRDGYAQVMTIPPNVRYQGYFLELQREAREDERGLWSLPLARPPSGGGAAGGATSGSPFIGNRNSLKFHLAECRWVREMNSANKVPFETRGAAIEAGYEPCKVCRP